MSLVARISHLGCGVHVRIPIFVMGSKQYDDDSKSQCFVLTSESDDRLDSHSEFIVWRP